MSASRSGASNGSKAAGADALEGPLIGNLIVLRSAVVDDRPLTTSC